jgi:predicted amidophosphoribosyltransferase
MGVTLLARAAHGLAALDRRSIPAVDMLIRVTTIPRRATGGERTTQSSRVSMRVQEFRNTCTDTIILLEDTVTTGTTIAAARQLLRQAGARRVGVVALARTVRYHGSTAGYHESTVRTR